jgi:hypothetical protein
VKKSLQHEITLDLASGARLRLLYFSDRELRWIFSYDYVGPKRPGETPGVIHGLPLTADYFSYEPRRKRSSETPGIVNDVRLVANYADGLLEGRFVLSMHVVIPNRLGQRFFTGLDISPGAKTYLAFNYERSADEYLLTEICKGIERVHLNGVKPAIIRPVAFPFPVPDRIPVKLGKLQVPFRTHTDDIAHFDLPERTLQDNAAWAPHHQRP